MEVMRLIKNDREKSKEAIIHQCIAGEITASDAAKRLNISVRQVENLKKKQREGVSFLHGNCGRVSKKATPLTLKQNILSLYMPLIQVTAVNFTHFHEMVKAKGVSISYTALRNILIEAGYTSPKTRRSKPKQHPSRERRAKFGELLQTDATPFEWFAGNPQKFALHALIDDCRGTITGMYMTNNECLAGYHEILRQTLETHGSPEAIYADGLSIFFTKSKADELTIEEQLSGIYERRTQLGQVAETLGIELIHARSAQAKGRVERLWETLQSRLPVEFYIRNITTVEEANKFLTEEYIDIFNSRFGVNSDSESCFVKLPPNVDLDTLLTHKQTRKLDNGSVFSLHNVKFRAENAPPKSTVTIHISRRGGVFVTIGNDRYEVTPLTDAKNQPLDSDSVQAILTRFVYAYCLKNEHTA